MAALSSRVRLAFVTTATPVEVDVLTAEGERWSFHAWLGRGPGPG